MYAYISSNSKGLRQLTKIATDLHMPIAAEYSSSLNQLESKFPGSLEIKQQPDVVPIIRIFIIIINSQDPNKNQIRSRKMIGTNKTYLGYYPNKNLFFHHITSHFRNLRIIHQILHG